MLTTSASFWVLRWKVPVTSSRKVGLSLGFITILRRSCGDGRDFHPNSNVEDWKKVRTCIMHEKRSYLLYPGFSQKTTGNLWILSDCPSTRKTLLGIAIRAGRPYGAVYCDYCLPAFKGLGLSISSSSISTFPFSWTPTIIFQTIQWQKEQGRAKLRYSQPGWMHLSPRLNVGNGRTPLSSPIPKLLELI